MEPIDIIYTPLDIPQIPKEFDLEKFKEWCKEVYPQDFYKKIPSSGAGEAVFGNQYPWDAVLARHGMGRGGWLNDFEKIFPEMADYFWQAFGIAKHELGTITLISTRDHIKGLGFWHSDRDITGLRMYIENTEPDENPIIFRKTKFPYTIIEEDVATWVSKDLNEFHPLLENEILTGKILGTQQAYYLNNIRAVHSPYITKPSSRLACFIHPHPDAVESVRQKTKDLIVRSAKKYKDYALFWK